MCQSKSQTFYLVKCDNLMIINTIAFWWSAGRQGGDDGKFIVMSVFQQLLFLLKRFFIRGYQHPNTSQYHRQT